MKSSSMDIPVHDIAPLMEIQEYSIYWFLLIIAMSFMVVFVLVKQFRKKKKSQEQNERAQRYDNFIRIDVSDAKTAAYAICEQGLFFAHDNEEILKMYRRLFESLEAYKYARTVEAIDEETLALYVAYQKSITLVV